jgi:serine/threonine protein kinase
MAMSDDLSKSFVGSIAYMAPEMLMKKGHSKTIDWYLFGVLLFELITGSPPYFSNNRDVLFQNIVNGVLRVPKGLSKDSISLIAKLLNRNPIKRLGSGPGDAQEIKDHPFFADIDWDKL